jgi:hypothetical protein
VGDALSGPVWRNVRFLRHEIEGARADFLAALEGREIEPDTLPVLPPQRKRRQSMQAEIEQFLAKLSQENAPVWWDWPDAKFCRELRKVRGFPVENKTIIRARKAVRQRETSKDN